MSLMSDIATAIKNKFILNDFYSQSNSLLTGGGTISVSATWEVKWSTRFITIGNGRGAALAIGGYFDITMPSVSTVITGAGGATNKTVTANGIPLASWETLYYILPLAAPNTTVNANFRVCSYTADINIPNNWIKICSKNDDGGYVDFACGISLRNNTSINTHLYDVKGADVDGAVSSANTLATARTISASGDIVGTATGFNGSANITIPMTLATIVDSGTGLFKKITTNAKGLVTGTTNVVQSDITGLLGSGSITNTMIANTAVSNLSGTNTGDQTITLTGDITGTGNGSFATALSDSGVTAGTYSKVTVDSKGRITAGMVQTMEDIPDATFKRSVKAATTANITLSGPQTVDGVTLLVGDRVLVKDHATPSENGIYVVAAGAWTRALDADTSSKIASAIVAVDSGTVNGGKLFDNDFKTTDTLGTTAMLWASNLDSGNLSSTIPIVSGTGTIGTATTIARADHIHPAQTTVSGNAGSATKLTTARTIGGVSFNGTANIDLPGVNVAGNQNTTGNSATATNASNLGGNAPSYYQQALGFTPIQQGGGAGQGSNKIYIGWQGPYLNCQVDNTNFGSTFPMNINGNAATATTAADSSKLIGKNWYWSEQNGQPDWLWGGSDGTNMYVYSPSNFNVNYANTAGVANNAIGYGQTWQNVTASRALGATYTNSTGKPIFVSFDSYGADTGSPQGMSIAVNGSTIAYTANSFSNGGLYQGYRQNLTAIVPAGATYMYNVSTPPHSFFINELR